MDLNMMRLGFSSFLTQIEVVVITAVNNVLLVRYGALSPYGAEIPMAALVVVMKLFQIVLNVSIGIGAGSQPIAGTNYGSGHYGRVRRLFILMMVFSFAVSMLCMIGFIFFPQPMVQIFGSGSVLYTEFAIRIVRIYLCLIVLTCMQKVCSIFLQSIGCAWQAALLSIGRDVLLIVFAVIFPVLFQLDGIIASAPAADCIAALITVFVMVSVFARMPKEGKESTKERVLNAAHAKA